VTASPAFVHTDVALRYAPGGCPVPASPAFVHMSVAFRYAGTYRSAAVRYRNAGLAPSHAPPAVRICRSQVPERKTRGLPGLQPELPRADEHHTLVQPGLGEDLVDAAEAEPNGRLTEGGHARRRAPHRASTRSQSGLGRSRIPSGPCDER